MTIKIGKSKTDQLRQRDEVLIARSGGRFCPIALYLLGALSIDPLSNEFIFRHLVKTKKSYKLSSNGKLISYSTFRDHLARDLQGIVPHPSMYGTHSFRSGGASKAAESGVSERVCRLAVSKTIWNFWRLSSYALAGN